MPHQRRTSTLLPIAVTASLFLACQVGLEGIAWVGSVPRPSHLVRTMVSAIGDSEKVTIDELAELESVMSPEELKAELEKSRPPEIAKAMTEAAERVKAQELKSAEDLKSKMDVFENLESVMTQDDLQKELEKSRTNLPDEVRRSLAAPLDKTWDYMWFCGILLFIALASTALWSIGEDNKQEEPMIVPLERCGSARYLYHKLVVPDLQCVEGPAPNGGKTEAQVKTELRAQLQNMVDSGEIGPYAKNPEKLRLWEPPRFADAIADIESKVPKLPAPSQLRDAMPVVPEGTKVGPMNVMPFPWQAPESVAVQK